jgi:myo-inositol-1(or 4)-monophosphatase
VNTPNHSINLAAALGVAKNAARAAGDVLLSYYESRYEVYQKSRDNPVTTADLKANEVLQEMLLGAFPHAGWLSEESVDDPGRMNKEWLWVVDPLDGTKEFIEGIDEFAVSIGLVHENRPVLAVTYNPAADIRVHCLKGSGTFANDTPVAVTGRTTLQGATVLSSRSETKRGLFDPFKDILDVQPTGSVAHKLAQMASGQADVTFSLAPKNEWDICAGVLLAEEAGATVTDLNGNRFLFNQINTLRNGVIAASTLLYPHLFELIRSKTK